jgi:hypothetical protein
MSLRKTILNISFRRELNGNEWNKFLHFYQRLMAMQLSNSSDKFVWKLTFNGIFTVKSMYLGVIKWTYKIHMYVPMES